MSEMVVRDGGMLLTLLDREQLGRRIRAARILRGLEQAELDELFAADGLGKSAGRLERGEPDTRLTRARLDGLVRHLQVPEVWFTAGSPDEFIWPTATEGSQQLETEIAAVRQDLDKLLRYREDAIRRLGPLVSDPESAAVILNELARVLDPHPADEPSPESGRASDQPAAPGEDEFADG